MEAPKSGEDLYFQYSSHNFLEGATNSNISTMKHNYFFDFLKKTVPIFSEIGFWHPLIRVMPGGMQFPSFDATACMPPPPPPPP